MVQLDGTFPLVGVATGDDESISAESVAIFPVPSAPPSFLALHTGSAPPPIVQLDGYTAGGPAADSSSDDSDLEDSSEVRG